MGADIIWVYLLFLPVAFGFGFDGVPTIDFSAQPLPLASHSTPFEHPEESLPIEKPEVAVAINKTEIEERVAKLEQAILAFVPSTSGQSSASTSSTDQLKVKVKQVSEKEQALLTKLATLTARLDDIEADDNARAEAATKTESDATLVKETSDTHADLENRFEVVKTLATSLVSTKNDIVNQIDVRVNGPGAEIAGRVDETTSEVAEHNGKVTKTGDTLSTHCTTLNLQGHRAMAEAEAALPFLDHLRSTEAFASSLEFGTLPENIIDGNHNSWLSDRSLLVTKTENEPWCIIKLARMSSIYGVRITARGDCCQEQVHNSDVYVLEYDPRDDPSYNGEYCTYISTDVKSGEKYEATCYETLRGQYVKLWLYGKVALGLAEFQALGYPEELVEGKAAIQSSTDGPKYGAMAAIDADPLTCTETRDYETDKEQFWIIDLQSELQIDAVEITNRNDDNFSWLSSFVIELSTEFPDSCSGEVEKVTCATVDWLIYQGSSKHIYCTNLHWARYVTIKRTANSPGKLSLCEVNIHENKPWW